MSAFCGVKTGNHGALVVHGASAVNFAVYDFAAEGRGNPTLGYGHDVEMSQNAEHLRVFVVGGKIEMSRVVVAVVGLKSHFLAFFQNICKAVRVVFAEGHTRQRVRGDRFKAQNLLKRFYHFSF